MKAMRLGLLAAVCSCWLLQGSLAGCREEALSLHNQLRARHGAHAMTWDDSLASEVQGLVTAMAQAGCALQHPPHGINLYVQLEPSSAGACGIATRHWYKQLESYQFSQQPWTDNQAKWGKIAHAMHMLWAESERIGCAQAASPAGCTVVGCAYGPQVVADDQLFFKNIAPALPAAATDAGVSVFMLAGTTLPRIPAKQPGNTWATMLTAA